MPMRTVFTGRSPEEGETRRRGDTEKKRERQGGAEGERSGISGRRGGSPRKRDRPFPRFRGLRGACGVSGSWCSSFSLVQMRQAFAIRLVEALQLLGGAGVADELMAGEQGGREALLDQEVGG